MELKYKKFEFSKILGWSSSRYELFSKCKRQYFYTYYSKYVKDVPNYKINELKALTSVPLELGNVIHDVLETLLKRLQQSDSKIDNEKFLKYGKNLTKKYFKEKTFIEVYYGELKKIELVPIYSKIETILSNFIESNIFGWIFMNAITHKTNWMIEPGGYGETRLRGLKAYCKMDFLFPIDGDVHIIDWKTGKRDEYKHKKQLIAYSAAANSNFNIDFERIFPKIVYLFPEIEEFEFKLTKDDLEKFFVSVKQETEEMQSFCIDVENNIPKTMEEFETTKSTYMCKHCNYREICTRTNEQTENTSTVFPF